MPELDTLDYKQFASLAGLAPIARDSGQHRGKCHIPGGRAELRGALYMPAHVAIRFNPDMKAKYTALVAAGRNRQRSRTQPSRGSSLSWQTRCSRPNECGRQNPLDHNGYSKLSQRLGRLISRHHRSIGARPACRSPLR
ncbi:transposase [Glacieibacterium megasporae]